jgi:hypothetical protein
MSEALYDKARDKFLTGDIDWTADTIKVALLGSGYTADMANDEFYSSVSSAVIGDPIAIANRSTAAGVANGDPVTSGTLSTGSTVTQIVIFKDTGDASTSPLIGRLDLSPIPTNGGNIKITWDTATNKIFRL